MAQGGAEQVAPLAEVGTDGSIKAPEAEQVVAPLAVVDVMARAGIKQIAALPVGLGFRVEAVEDLVIAGQVVVTAAATNRRRADHGEIADQRQIGTGRTGDFFQATEAVAQHPFGTAEEKALARHDAKNRQRERWNDHELQAGTGIDGHPGGFANRAVVGIVQLQRAARAGRQHALQARTVDEMHGVLAAATDDVFDVGGDRNIAAQIDAEIALQRIEHARITANGTFEQAIGDDDHVGAHVVAVRREADSAAAAFHLAEQIGECAEVLSRQLDDREVERLRHTGKVQRVKELRHRHALILHIRHIENAGHAPHRGPEPVGVRSE